MSETINNVINILNKFIGPILLLILSILFTLQLSMGSVNTEIDNIKTTIDEIKNDYKEYQTKTENVVNNLASITSNLDNINMQVNEIKDLSKITRLEQLERSDVIQWVRELRKLNGWSTTFPPYLPDDEQ